ncbi:MAG: neutral/alkaline non-lysosomal ceramidase N-terminal domain-containing protein [bacterium]
MRRILILLAAAVLLSGIAMANSVPELVESAKAPMVNLFADSPPTFKDITVSPAKPYNNESITISARVFADPTGMSYPVKSVKFYARYEGAGEWDVFDMIKSPLGNDTYFAVVTPPAGAKNLFYSIVAQDTGGNAAIILPRSESVDMADDKSFFFVDDINEDDNLVPKELDFLAIGFARDAENVYFMEKIEGTPGPGNLSKGGANFYFMPFLPPGEGIASFLGGSGVVLAYTPLAASLLGIPKYGLINIKDIISGNKNLAKTGVKLVKTKNALAFKTPFKDLPAGDEWILGLASGRITPPAGIAPMDTTPFVRVLLRGGEIALLDGSQRKPAPLKAGASKFEISSPIGTPLAGYGDRVGVPSKAVHDPLMGTAIVIESEGRFYCFVGLDFFYMNIDVYKDIATKANKLTGLPESCFIIGASHSHHASGALIPVLAILGGRFQPKVYESVVDRIVKGIVVAYKNMKPARIGAGFIKTTPEMPTNGNRKKDGGLVDNSIGILKIDTLDNKPIATLFNHSGHPTGIASKTMQQSSDFVGPARNAIEKNGGGVAVFFNGSLGDHSARCSGKCDGDDFAKVKQTGENIASYVTKGRKSIATSDKATLRLFEQWALLRRDTLSYTIEKGVVLDDKYAFVTVPGELFFDPLGNQLREQAKTQGIEHLFILGITNDGLGYIYPEELYYAHDYEATYTAYGPKLSPFIVDNESALIKSFGK